jgi:hypothetical protein
MLLKLTKDYQTPQTADLNNSMNIQSVIKDNGIIGQSDKLFICRFVGYTKLGISHMCASATSVLCGSCGQQLEESPQLLPEQRTPCPTCGSTTRNFNVEIHETVTARTKLGLKHKRQGLRKPIYEEVSGEDLHRKTGLWSKLLRIIDRQNNRYKEEIINSETGEVLRTVDHPLTDHVDRGSAKKKGKGDTDA